MSIFEDKLIQEIDSSSGFATLFLVLAAINIQNIILSSLGILTLILFIISSGIISPIVRKVEANSIEAKFEEAGERMLDKLQKSGWQRVNSNILIITSGLLFFIEIFLFMTGIFYFITKHIIINIILTLLWILFALKFGKNLIEAIQMKQFRSFVVKFSKTRLD